MTKIKVKLFGAFRNYIESGELDVTISEKVNVQDFKKILGLEINRLNPEFQDEKLIHDSAIANEDKILFLEDMVEGTFIALLPPVCGG